jgi:hypothetical protein
VVADRDGSGASRLRVAPWLPAAASPQPADADAAGAGTDSGTVRPQVAVIAGLEPVPPDQPAEPASLLRPVRLDRAGRQRGRWWFVLVPAVVIALVVAVAVQLRAGPAPWRPPLPQMSPQVVLPELTPSAGPPTGGPTGSASPSASRRTSTAPTGTASGGRQPAPAGTGTGTPSPTIAAGAQPGSILGADGRCVEPTGSGPGSFIQLATCESVAKQQWSAPGDGTVRTLGFCLEVLFGRRSGGTPVVLSTCNAGGAQQWQPDANGWRNPQSNRCLTGGGSRLTIEDCTGAANQRFSLT